MTTQNPQQNKPNAGATPINPRNRPETGQQGNREDAGRSQDDTQQFGGAKDQGSRDFSGGTAQGAGSKKSTHGASGAQDPSIARHLDAIEKSCASLREALGSGRSDGADQREGKHAQRTSSQSASNPSGSEIERTGRSR